MVSMKFLKQNDVPVENVRLYGCRFMCLLYFAQVHAMRNLNEIQIKQIYDWAVQQGDDVMNAQCLCGKDEHKIIDFAVQVLASNRVIIRQAGYVDENNMALGWDGQPFSGMALGVVASWPTDVGQHFTVIKLGVDYTMYDPWDYDKVGFLNVTGKIQKRLIYQKTII